MHHNNRALIARHPQTQFTYDDIMEIDHIIPKAKGGSNDFVNLQLLHRHCHDIKTSLD